MFNSAKHLNMDSEWTIDNRDSGVNWPVAYERSEETERMLWPGDEATVSRRMI